MSGWIMATKRLHELGGGPLRPSKFDPLATGKHRRDVRRAVEIGSMEITETEPIKYSLTPKGRDLCEGRAKVGRNGHAVAIVQIIGESVPDALIVRLLEQTGRKPGSPMTFEDLQRYSSALVAEVRRAVEA